jgi:hypothetical protein
MIRALVTIAAALANTAMFAAEASAEGVYAFHGKYEDADRGEVQTWTNDANDLHHQRIIVSSSRTR